MTPIDRRTRLLTIRDLKHNLDREYDNTQARLDQEKLIAEQEWYAARLELESEEGDLLRLEDADENTGDPDCTNIPAEVQP